MICSKCKKEITEDKILNRKEGKKKAHSWCYDCVINANYEFNKTKKGVLRTIFYTQILGSKKRGHDKPSYTKDEFIKYGLNNNYFNIIYDRWVALNYDKDEKPSFDRIDSKKGYSFDNIQIMTWRENNIKGRNENKKCKKVAQYTLDGIFLKQFDSISEATKEVNGYKGNIIKCCNGKAHTASGFKWKYI